MIRGIVNDEDVPMVTFSIAGQTWDAIVDTGFNGDLELPDSLRSFLNPRFLCRVRSFLASGQSIEEDNYLVDLTFDDRTASVEATFSPGREILIGTHLLRKHRLEINFSERSVCLERVSE